jgi:farnesyl-diphosphate farnesyltransferase
MADLDLLLERTSRTFALSIPLLPEPTRREVTIAYLLFRIADTFEDCFSWPRDRRIEALERFCALLRLTDGPTAAAPGAEGQGAAESWVIEARQLASRWAVEMPVSHDGYRELLEETPQVLQEYASLRAEARGLIGRHTVRTATGMARYVAGTGDDGRLQLQTLQDLRDYCYVVAGIVGEMLTELFLLGRPTLRSIGPYLRERSRAFGEGLQLVNILKDSATDIREGRAYIPAAVQRAEVFDLARLDLEAASEYTLALQSSGAETGLVAFNALPVRLAWATLDRVERGGPGAKISRAEVWEIVAELQQALQSQRPAVSPPVGHPTG